MSSAGGLSAANRGLSARPRPADFLRHDRGRRAERVLQPPLRRPAGAGRGPFDVVLVHRGAGRVFRAVVLGDGRDDAADGRRRARHAVPDARNDDDLPVPEHGARENEAALGGGGAQVLRLWLGVVGAVSLRPQPDLRHDGHDSARRDPKRAQDGGATAGLSGNVAGATAILLLMVGFGFKIAAVPFHQWAPDAYEGHQRRWRPGSRPARSSPASSR